jgi:RimJ/RimL family protein N-acetyltransferase
MDGGGGELLRVLEREVKRRERRAPGRTTHRDGAGTRCRDGYVTGQAPDEMTNILETERLCLREMSLQDLDFLAALLAHPEVMQFWPKCYNRDEAADWIKRQQLRYAEDGVGYWLMLDKTTQQPVGQAGLLVLKVDGVREMGLGYILHREFWRMGYATEAAQASRDYGFRLGHRRIVALVRPENLPSHAVARRLGMQVEKQTHYAYFDHLVFVAQAGDGA